MKRLNVISIVLVMIIAGCAAVQPVDENNRGPVILRAVKPVYPQEARKKGIEGEVLLRMWVNENGKVTRVMVERTPDLSLCDAAMSAAMKTTFKPAMLDGKPIGVWYIAPISVTR